MKKSLTCVLLCVALLCNSTVFVHAAGDGGEFGYNNSLSWYFDGVDTLSISGKGAMNTWYSNIPWRDYKEMVKKVIINEGVTDIGNNAFYGFLNLNSISIPSSVSSIGNSAFYNCRSITGIELPLGLETIGELAFMQCSNLVSIAIPNSVNRMGDSVFNSCGSLACVILPEGITEIPELAFSWCTNLETITIPKGVTKIGDSAFAHAGIRSITIPDGVTSIGDRTFEVCTKLTNVIMPESVEKIGPFAFCNCDKLAAISIPNKVTVIEDCAFANCSSLTSIAIPSGVVSIGRSAFSDTGITSITIPASVLSIGEKAFYGIPNVIYLGDNSIPQEMVKSNNISKNNYDYHASTISSYLYKDGDALVRVEEVDGDIIVEYYSASLQLISARKIKHELSYKSEWGGFFAGKNYNFIIIGLGNPEESSTAEVVRVIKYDKNWNELDHASLRGADTVAPFAAGAVRCAEHNGILYIHTSHTMYADKDGLRHQSNMTLSVNQSDMTIKKSDPAYVSHSFNQFILVDQDSRAVMLDHGDAFPRSIVILRKDNPAGNMSLSGDGIGVMIQKFPGKMGNNTTGASVGGLTETQAGYVVAYNYNGGYEISEDETPFIIYSNGVDQSPNAKYARNVYLAFTAKTDFGKSGAVIKQITSYESLGTLSAGTPQLVSTGLDGGYVLWEIFERDDVGKLISTGKITYARYNSYGEITDVQTVRGALSDCQPIVFDGKILWYVTQNSEPLFYMLDASGLIIYRSPEFSDVNKRSWYYDAVRFVYNAGFMTKTGINSFNPDSMADRATIVTALYNMDDLKDNKGITHYYQDVDENLRPIVSWAVVNRIANGYDTWHFGPSDSVTREQFATFMYRYAQAKGYDTSKRANLSAYSDASQISDYAREAMQWANAEGLISGTSSSTLSPKGTTTRAVVATILKRFCEKYRT